VILQVVQSGWTFHNILSQVPGGFQPEVAFEKARK